VNESRRAQFRLVLDERRPFYYFHRMRFVSRLILTLTVTAFSLFFGIEAFHSHEDGAHHRDCPVCAYSAEAGCGIVPSADGVSIEAPRSTNLVRAAGVPALVNFFRSLSTLPHAPPLVS
jgi:hypothetical protein